MELFYRRPLCFFCFLFIAVSALIGYMGSGGGLISVVLVSLLAAAVLVLCFVVKKHQVLFVSILLCVCAVMCAVFNSYFRVERKREQALKFEGSRSAQMYVTDTDSKSEHISVYTVNIEKLSDESVSIKALLVCAFPVELSVGDELNAYVEIMNTDARALGMSAKERGTDDDILLTAVLYDAEGATVTRFPKDISLYEAIMMKNGVRVVTERAKAALGNRMEALLGDASGLAKGFLLGDREDISTETVRDFRRTGLSHLFAVSGMHIAILLGAIEVFLRRLYVYKYIRCAIVSAASIPMLALTGFALSAWRSVLMLWMVYINFLTSEDDDPPTALFLSISIIIAVFPYSVYDLGMWLSFCATLGLVSAYPFITEKLPKVKKGIKRLPLRILKGALLVALMTVICSLFVLPLQWYVFGEMSVISVVANILLSPITTVFMVSIIIAVILGGVPFIGGVAVSVVIRISEITEAIVGTLSTLDFAMVSLRYPFADALVVLFTAALAVLLVVKIKRKWLLVLHPVCFALVFSVCVIAFNLYNPKKITYYGNDTRELITLSVADGCAMVDLSNGAYFRYAQALSDASHYGATEVDKLVFTDITKNHISSMDYFMRSNIVKSIYIPYPSDEYSRQNAFALAALAIECGAEVNMYSSGEILTLDGLSFCVLYGENQDKTGAALFVSTEEGNFGYADAFVYGSDVEKGANALLSKCDTVIIGNNGVPDRAYKYNVSEKAMLIYASENIRKKSRMTNKAYCADTQSIYLEFPLK